MNEATTLRLAKWPFLAGDFLLVATGAFAVLQGRGPLTIGQGLLCAGAVALGAALGVTPFVLEYRALLKLSQTATLFEALKQLRNLEHIAHNVSAATAQWRAIQDQSAQTAKLAKEIGDQMAVEATAFTEFLKKANDSERATLRLEVEKLHRAQGDWLQVVVRTLDHVGALRRAAVQSGKPDVIAQITGFQDACRDIARRVGLAVFEAAADDPFDAARHRVLDEHGQPSDGARIAETVASGYTFQGQPVRPALVTLKTEEAAPKIEVESPANARKPEAIEQVLL